MTDTKEATTGTAAPPDDVIEMDEICLRQSSSLWLWIAISRKVRQVIGFVVGNHSDAMLPALWSDVPTDYRDKPVNTDGWSAYARFFPTHQHQIVAKGPLRFKRTFGETDSARFLKEHRSGFTQPLCPLGAGLWLSGDRNHPVHTWSV
jgi:IS1 family transposase